MKITQRQTNGPAPCSRAEHWELLLYEYAEEQASPQTRTAVENHIRECAYCRGALADIRFMMAALHTAAPEPTEDLTARVMKSIRREEEENGRVTAQAVDADTGRVLSAPGSRIAGIARLLGGIAAVLALVLGLRILSPLMSGGTSGAASDVIGELQNQTAGSGTFADGVFYASADAADTAAAAETDGEADGFAAVPSSKDRAESDDTVVSFVTEELIAEEALHYSAYIYVDKASWNAACDILTDPAEYALYAGLTAETAAEITVAVYDGYLTVAPASAFETVTAALHAADLIYFRDDAAVGDSHEKITRTDAVYVGVEE